MSSGVVDPTTDLVDRICNGDRGALAAAISAVADGRPEAARLLAAAARKAAGDAPAIGVTGPPGAGKSTLVGRLTIAAAERGRKVAVLLVDPSSPVTRGALLGDRVRMQRSTEDNVYVRSVASRGDQGGLPATAPGMISLLRAWGADLILLETVGAGQSEVDVASVADRTVLVTPPGLGDTLQAMKAGLMELADIFVINKADRPGAETARADLGDAGPGGALGRIRPVILTIATDGSGVDELLDEIESQAAELTTAESPRRSRTLTRGEVIDLPFSLSGRVALVTGASGGLGRRFAEVLHAAGASVVLVARRTDRLTELEARLERATSVACDINDPAQRLAAVQAAVDRFGSLDVLVNNAGTSGPAVPSEEMSPERWESTIATNLSGQFGMIQAAAGGMLERGHGSIVNIGSVFGLVANAPVTDAAYAASKGAIVNLTRELGVEWALRGIRVNAIAPGWFPSEMTAGMIDDDASQRYIARFCPMQRMGHAHELDGALLFLASDASSYCTGQTFAIDGGWTAR